MATQADVDNLNEAIRTGVRSVTIGGQTTIYNTIESLKAARDDAVRELNAEAEKAATPKNRRQTYAYYDPTGYR